MTRATPTGAAHLFRRVALPLGCYYAVTLVLPLANGAAQSGAAFVHHALAVLVVPPILIGVACAIRKVFLIWARPSAGLRAHEDVPRARQVPQPAPRSCAAVAEAR